MMRYIGEEMLLVTRKQQCIENKAADQVRKNIKRFMLAAFGLLLSLFIIFLSIKYSDTIKEWKQYGFLGLFAGCFLTNASIFMPTISIALVVSCAYSLNPFLCGIIGGFGTACGELVGYAFGRSGRAVMGNNRFFNRIETFTGKYAFLSVLLFSFLPIPIFDIVGVACGISRVKVAYFFTPCVIGKVIKMIIIAYFSSKFNISPLESF